MLNPESNSMETFPRNCIFFCHVEKDICFGNGPSVSNWETTMPLLEGTSGSPESLAIKMLKRGVSGQENTRVLFLQDLGIPSR